MKIAASVPRRIPAACALGLLTWTLSGCGGNGNPVAAPTPTPTATPAPAPTLVGQNSVQGVESGGAVVITLTTPARGTLTTNVDWTFASNDLDIFLVAGNDPCGEGATSCSILDATASETRKPETLAVSGLVPGPYTIYIVNFGPGTESLSFQVFFTNTGSATSMKTVPLGTRSYKSVAGLKKRPALPR